MNWKHSLTRISLTFFVLLTQGELTILAETCVQPPPGIIAWWSLDETDGTKAKDRVGDHPAGYSGAPLPADGLVEGSILLDGNDYLAVADNDLWAFGTKNFTIELWANFNTQGGGSIGHPGDILIGNDEGPGTLNKWFFALGGGKLNFHYNGPGVGSRFFPLVSFLPNIDQWYHLAITRKGSLYTIFIDGISRGSEIDTISIPNAEAPLTIGQAEQLGFLNGRLDEVTIYNRALTEEEIRAIFEAGSAGKCIDLTIRPNRGGDTGRVSVNINGTGFSEGATVKLTKTGESDVLGSSVRVENDSTRITTTFDLAAKTQGAWDVIIEDDVGTSFSLHDGFTIEEGKAPQLWVDIVGLNLIRPGRQQTYWVNYGNNGNVDALGGYVFIHIPQGIEYSLGADPNMTSETTDSLHTLIFNRLHPSEVRTIPLNIKTPLNAEEVELGVDIRESLEMVLEGFNRREQFYPSSLNLTHIRDSEREGVHSIRSPIVHATEKDYTKPILGSGEAGDTGYIHYFWIEPAEGSEFFAPFGEAAIAISSDTVGWSFPGELQGVVEAPFITAGNYNFVDEGKQYTAFVRHIYGLRPFPEDEMGEFADQVNSRFDFWRGTPFNDPSEFTIDHDAQTIRFSSLSCMGLVAKVLFPNGYPPDFPVPDTNLVTTETLFQYLNQLNEDESESILEAMKDILDGQELPGEIRQFLITIITSFDPNDKVGSRGVGTLQYVTGEGHIRYTIFFENLETATAPAQEVTIIDQLDTVNMDTTSVRLGPITFGGRQIAPQPELSAFSADVDLGPEQKLFVRIEASLNPNSGVLTWHFTSIDPNTGDPPSDPTAGFLPPNVNPPEGDGSVQFMVMPKANLPSGTNIKNQAEIVFDANDLILTPQWINTLDNTKPTSHVLSLASTQGSTDFLVEWSGTDEDGSGVRDYTIYISENDRPFTIWLNNVSYSSAVFRGVFEQRYAFYSIARDRTGNLENTPESADTSTVVTLRGVFYDDFESGDTSAWSLARGEAR